MQASSAPKEYAVVSSKFKQSSAFIKPSLRLLILDTAAAVIQVTFKE